MKAQIQGSRLTVGLHNKFLTPSNEVSDCIWDAVIQLGLATFMARRLAGSISLREYRNMATLKSNMAAVESAIFSGVCTHIHRSIGGGGLLTDRPPVLYHESYKIQL